MAHLQTTGFGPAAGRSRLEHRAAPDLTSRSRPPSDRNASCAPNADPPEETTRSPGNRGPPADPAAGAASCSRLATILGALTPSALMWAESCTTTEST